MPPWSSGDPEYGLVHRVLVVDNDHGLRDFLTRGLRDERFVVTTAVDGATAVRSVNDEVDAVVLDVRLPDSDGRDVCQALRAQGFDGPIVFLTAHDHLNDRLSGFSAGGDDYLVKPCHIAELAARIRAALRRGGRPPGIFVPNMRLDPVEHVLSGDGLRIVLTPTEFRLLACLMATPGAVLRRRTLVYAAWPAGAYVSDNTLDQYATRLRRKLRNAGCHYEIGTVRGVGYQFR